MASCKFCGKPVVCATVHHAACWETAAFKGAKVSRYYATEIDKYAIQTTQHNFPDTVQLGDAFQVREEDWTL